jgi:DNA-binding NtrC family response regulator
MSFPRALYEMLYAEAQATLLKEFKRAYVSDLLERTKGNKSAAAKLAGRDRSGLRRLTKEAGLS